MKRINWLIVGIVLAPCLVFGQLKKQSAPVDIRSGILQADNGKYLGIIDPSRLTVNHSYSLSYYSMGDLSFGRSLYLNTLSYRLADPLSLKVQWGIQNFPYTSAGANNPAFRSGFVFSGAQLKYRPSDKFMIKFEYSALPRAGYYYPGSWRYSRSSVFDIDDDLQ